MTKTTWTARTKTQLVAALARKGFNRADVREACDRAASNGFAAVADIATENVAIVTYGDTEVDAYDAEIMPYDEGMDKGTAMMRAREASPFVADPANPTDAELSAAIERGLVNGSLITWEDFMKADVVLDLELRDPSREVVSVSADGIVWDTDGSAADVTMWLGNAHDVDRQAIRLAAKQVGAEGRALRISFPSVMTFLLSYWEGRFQIFVPEAADYDE